MTRASATDDLADVEALQRRAFTNAWGAEALRWELKNTDVARLYLMRTPDGALAAYCACWMVFDELHINSTPTLFFADGRRVAGAIPVEELQKLLAAGGAPKVAAPNPTAK